MSKKKKVVIITDGASSLIPSHRDEYGLMVVPVYVNFEDATYKAGVDLDSRAFYDHLAKAGNLPSTAQPSPQDFLDIYTQLSDEAEEIIAVVISPKLSATLESAMLAKEQFTKIPVHIFDSETVSMGLGLMAIAAARAGKEGKSPKEILDLLHKIKQKMNVIFTVETLEYLHKGGRIGGATAFLGSTLSIKPLLYIKDGQIEPLERVRTRNKAVARLVEIVEEKVGNKAAHFAVLHCDAEERARELAEEVKTKFKVAEIDVFEAGPVIGTHAGPGTLGLAFYTE